MSDESNEDGLTPTDGVEVARLLGRTGLVDFLNVNGKWGGDADGLSKAIPGMAYPGAPFIELARRVKEASGVPTLQSARITDLATADHAIANGCMDMVGMTRSHMADPHIVAKLLRGDEQRIRPCVGAGYCIDRVTTGYDTACVHNAATGRERQLSHSIAKAPVKRRVVVISGGPAGLEASRVSAARGHDVVLFEAGPRLGGQLLLAAKASWRKDMIAIARWLESEVGILGVEVHLNRMATAADVLALNPDVVIVATGGVPTVDIAGPGRELAISTWDVLSGQAVPGERILIFDDAGGHAAISTADALADGTRSIELVSRDRHVAQAVGVQNFPVYLRNLYRKGVRMTPDHRLMRIERNGNAFVAHLRNEYSREEVLREVDQVIVEQGTVPADEVFHDLVTHSRNLGDVDLDALVEVRPQPASTNHNGTYELYRVGDALAGRDLHAAILDSLRLCSAL